MFSLGSVVCVGCFWWCLLFLFWWESWYLGILQLLHFLLTSKRTSDRQGHELDRLQRKKMFYFFRFLFVFYGLLFVAFCFLFVVGCCLLFVVYLVFMMMRVMLMMTIGCVR